MKYFVLAFGEMSLRSVGDLISMGSVPAFVITHKSYLYDEYKEKFYDKLEELCSANNVELLKTDKVTELKDRIKETEVGICAGFMEIIKNDVFDAPKFGILNLHCGELPEYRGRAPISRTIIDGRDSLFMTLHKVDEGVDSGDVLLEKALFIEEDDDVNTLYYKCSINSASIIRDGLEMLRTNKADSFRKQEISEKNKPHKKITDEERKIDWQVSVKHIFNKIRALTIPYPAAFTHLNGVQYNFLKAKPVYSSNISDKFGIIYEVHTDFILINCKNGILMVYDIRDKDMEIAEIKSTFKEGDIFN
ncbi:MAG: formyltransferase family protein [Ignavibacteriota bacterium]